MLGMKKHDDVALSSLTAASGNGFCEVVFGGLMIIPAAFVFLGPTVKEAFGSSFAMGFHVLPNVFDKMPLGAFFGFLFFFLLFLAAVTSSLSMLQPAIALLEEGLGLSRKASVAMLGFITAVGASFIAFFSHNLAALATVDFWMAEICIFVMALIQIVIFGWIWGVDTGLIELKRGAEIRIPGILRFILKYITPVYLGLVFGFWGYKQLIAPINKVIYAADAAAREKAFGESAVLKIFTPEHRVALFSVIFILVVFALFTLLVAQSIKRWKRLEREQGVDLSQPELDETEGLEVSP